MRVSGMPLRTPRPSRGEVQLETRSLAQRLAGASRLTVPHTLWSHATPARHRTMIAGPQAGILRFRRSGARPRHSRGAPPELSDPAPIGPPAARDGFAIPCSRVDSQHRGGNRLSGRGKPRMASRDADQLLQHASPPALSRRNRAQFPRAGSLPQANGRRRPRTQKEETTPEAARSRATTPLAVDEPMRQRHLSAAAVAIALQERELAGKIERHPGSPFPPTSCAPPIMARSICFE